MYVNNCDKTMEPQDVLNIVLSTSIHDAEMNPIGNVISSLTDAQMWKIPVINKTDSGFRLSYEFCEEGPGIAITTITESPKVSVLKGDLFIEWLPEPTRFTFTEVVKCPIIEAENALKLFKTPVPFFYIPKEIGECTIDSNNYWYIDYGFSPTSQEFQSLVNDQPFEFIDNAFGNHFTMKKESTGWTGNNFSLVCNHTSIIAGEKNDDGAIIGIHDSDMNKFIIKQEFNIDYGSNFFTQLYNNGKLKFYDHNGHDMTISVVSEGTFPFHTGQGHAMIFNTNQGLLNKFTAKLISENISLTFSWDKNQHGVENLIYSIKYKYTGNIDAVDTLRLYLKKTCYDLVSEDIPYTDMKINPFGFLVEKEYYDIIHINDKLQHSNIRNCHRC